MVVTRERHATEVGLQVLKSGANAVDAALLSTIKFPSLYR